MTPEQLSPNELTPDQMELAQSLIEWCDLKDVADEPLIMMGQSGTVLYGLGRCAHHFADITPDEIKLMVMTKLKEQKTNPTK